MEPYQVLANAVVEQAVKDYKTALKYHFIHPEKTEYEQDVKELERFFHSDWYCILTDLDADYLINGVKAIVRKEVSI